MYLTLCDFDRVLYNTDEMKKECSKQLEEKGVNTSIFWYYYNEIDNRKGYFDPQELYSLLNEYHHGVGNIPGWGDISRELIESYPYERHILPEATEALNLIRILGKVIIWSQGEETYQSRKIASCKLPSDGVFVSADKVADRRILLDLYNPDMLAVIDDDPDILSAITEADIKIRIRNSIEEPFTIMDAAEYLVHVLSRD